MTKHPAKPAPEVPSARRPKEEAEFQRYLARLHSDQAANLRKRAITEDEDAKKCLARAEKALTDVQSITQPANPRKS